LQFHKTAFIYTQFIMSTISITTTQNIEVEYDLASLGERVVGWILDVVLIIVYILVLLFTIIGLNDLVPFVRNNGWMVFFFILPIFFYDLACEVLFNGQSLGKKVMGIKVISLNGEQPSLGQYLIRWLFRLVDFTFTNNLCALIMVAATEKRQRLGDTIAGTTLVKIKPRTSIQQTLYVPTDEEDKVYNATYPEVVNLSDSDIQLVKEVLINVQRSGNTMLALQAMNKIEQVLQITSKQEPSNFLYTILADYNNLASKL
jgi:uncharacterized RDD family membrane protein YckC